MIKNVGTVDRSIRIIVGLAILSLAFLGPQTAWGYLGLIPLATGLTGSCLPYQWLGINTCCHKQDKTGEGNSTGGGGCCGCGS